MSQIKQDYDNNVATLTAKGAPWELTSKHINNIEYRYYVNAPKTLPELFSPGREHGDSPFVVYEGDTLSFNEFFKRADALSQALLSDDKFNQGDCVAIAMRNYPEWMIAFVAITQAGGIVVPLNSWWQKQELEYALNDSQANTVFCDEQRFEHIASYCQKNALNAIVARSSTPLPETAVDFYQYAANHQPTKPDITLQPDSPAMIMYTSGTTGKPKGAFSSHESICQAIYNFEFAGSAFAMSSMDVISTMLEKGYPQSALLSVPLFHVSGCYSVFLLSLRAGRKIVMMYKWSSDKALELIEKERITSVSAVPSMVLDLLENPKFESTDTDSLFSIGGGGAAQPAKLSQIIKEKCPDSFPGTGYGMTETNAAGFAATGTIYHYRPNSVGPATPIVECKICDEEGNTLPANQRGEIYLKTPSVIKGYWNKPEANKESFVDGWFITGDIGYLDEEGFLYIVDRSKDMVIRGGENIYSAEVEQAIHEHPDVQEVAVLGLPHEQLGEELAAVIRTKEKSDLTVEQITEHVKERLAAFKVPSKIKFHAEELPKNAAGKVLKKALKESF